MFGSNVQPKKVMKEKPTEWYCHHCDKEVAAWWKKCPDCKSPRND